jgi:sec-independent protein translocase protein TatC
MPLRAHLTELRKRFVRSAIAILLGAVGGWYLYEPVFDAAGQADHRHPARARPRPRRSTSATSPVPFNLQMQTAIVIGFVIARPSGSTSCGPFITPGLTRRERSSSIGFLAAAVPLFLGGAALAWLVLPKAIDFLYEFIPQGGSAVTDASIYFSFVTRIVLAFGIAFVTPVVLVSLNLVGMLPGKTLLRHWRIIVFVCFLFAAIATPTPEATSMIVLAAALCLLFAIAVGICLLADRRKARRAPDLESIPDDTASPL